MDTAAISSKNQYLLIAKFQQLRQTTLDICNPIEHEDYVVQPCPEVSPPKWHLGHTSWFFEEVILKKYLDGYVTFNSHYGTLFNSYYKAVGQHTIQSERGYLSRPTLAEIMRYRAHVDSELTRLINEVPLTETLATLIETGMHHEQQHQELLFMDVKYILASNLLDTSYALMPLEEAPKQSQKDNWTSYKEGVYEIGYQGLAFSYDNERPRHKHYLYPFAINQSLVTNGDFLAFIQDSGYKKANYWLSKGWEWVNERDVQHPLYWRKIDNRWYEYTLHGLTSLDFNRPLVHISYFEADAFANWKGQRLPTEQELELYLTTAQANHHLPKAEVFHPNDALAAEQVWCWTRSQYLPYPNFKAFDGVLNEYNGKFMCNQFVLRGGCVVTPEGHYRHSYRNFYSPEQRWMFSGIRLAKDLI
ncbi:MAG: ergothioneine biosynthesis protein EgtB [Methylotenera sp.]